MTSMWGVSSFTLAGNIMRTGTLSQPHTRWHTSHAFIVNLINPVEDGWYSPVWNNSRPLFFSEMMRLKEWNCESTCRGRHTCFCVNHSPVSLRRGGWLLLALSRGRGTLGGVRRPPRPLWRTFSTPYPLYVSRRTRYKSRHYDSPYQKCQKTVRFHVN